VKAPDFGAERFRRLRSFMDSSSDIKQIAAALARAQKKMGVAVKDAKNPFFKSKYADLGAVMEVVKDPLNDAGITILQPPFTRDHAHYIKTILLHESGEFLSFELKLELTKTDMQSLGSAITYARRYMLQALLAIPAEDDDGNAATHSHSLPNPVQPKINAAIDAFESTTRKALIQEMMALVKQHSIPDHDIKLVLEKNFKGVQAKQLSNSELQSLIEDLNFLVSNNIEKNK
jgi:hypothetical protein